MRDVETFPPISVFMQWIPPLHVGHGVRHFCPRDTICSGEALILSGGFGILYTNESAI